MSIDISRLPVRPEQKIAGLLKEHPEMLEVLVAQDPAFNKLKNPLMRKTFARMATVSHAASMSGIALPELLRVLNGALGVDLDIDELTAALAGGSGATEQAPSTSSAATGMPVVGAMFGGAPPGEVAGEAKPAWLATADVVAELDAREMQHRGEDPFFKIQDTARTVEQGQAFRLRNTFQPFPLYAVLGGKGFVHHAEELGDGDWLITFYRERAVTPDVDSDDTHPHGATRPPAAGDATPGAGSSAGGGADAGSSHGAPSAAEVDALFASDSPPSEGAVKAVVRIVPDDLTPPMPMMKVLEGLAPLAPGDLLLVHHMRVPPHLTAKLDEQGHRYKLWDLGPDAKDILIVKAGG